jgi:hypothetical protein
VPGKPLRQEQVSRRPVDVRNLNPREWYRVSELSRRKNVYLGDPPGDWGAWTTVRFPSQGARDRFLLAVAGIAKERWEAKGIALDDEGARVRWREGYFLGLNDLAVAHRGRIIVTAVPRSV